MPIAIRPAMPDDQATIVRIVRAARINPMSLHWSRFFVAEEAGDIIGTVQIKLHRDGVYELASLAVVPSRQGAGIGAMLVRSIQARTTAPLYLTCADRMEGFYQRFGFRRVEPRALPATLGRIYVIGNILLGIFRQGVRLLVMRCDED
ncbi:MAG: GNAT family N-acetyltransferase [Chloroflexales bacterium]|nr:GNAT family N-acetyltransferase [Chloroflexales bacterium]